jgi:hypothetical protein
MEYNCKLTLTELWKMVEFSALEGENRILRTVGA